MLVKKVRLDQIVINLDNFRKPLNNVERNSMVEGKLYPYCGANGIIDYINEFIFDEEILCIAEDGGSWGYNQKCCYLMDEKCWVNNHAHVIKATEVVDIKYLYYYLNHKDLNNKITGTTRGKLTKTALNSIEVSLPSLDIQKKIANILDQAQELIDKRKAQIEALDELVQSVFYDMFGDPVINEKSWNIDKFKNLGELKRGKSSHRPRNAPELLNGPYPLIQTGDIANAGLYIKEYDRTYSELGLQQSKMWPKGTLCITIAANIAKTGILTFDSCFPDSVVAFINDDNIVNKMYIQIWMSFLQSIIEESAPESAQKNINLKILGELDVIIPPIELQNQFAEIVENIEKQKELLNESLVELENNFNSLMQRAFSGGSLR